MPASLALWLTPDQLCQVSQRHARRAKQVPKCVSNPISEAAEVIDEGLQALNGDDSGFTTNTCSTMPFRMEYLTGPTRNQLCRRVDASQATPRRLSPQHSVKERRGHLFDYDGGRTQFRVNWDTQSTMPIEIHRGSPGRNMAV